jgi:hypothetical protein
MDARTHSQTDSEIENDRRFAQDRLESLRNVSLDDLLSEESRRYKRALLALSVIGWIAAHYSIDVREIPWLSIPAPADAEHLFAYLIVVALCYHGIAFSLHAFADIMRWQLSQSYEQLRGQANAIQSLSRSIHGLASILHPNRAFTDPQLARLPETKENLERFSVEATRTFWSLAGAALAITKFKRSVAWIWDFALPLLAAGVALGGLILALAQAIDVRVPVLP